jgi:hypothetical protein
VGIQELRSLFISSGQLMDDSLRQWQVLYGTGDGGTWYVLRGLYGRLPPETLEGAPLLGDVADVMRKVLDFRMRASGVRRSTTPTTTENALEIAERVHATMADELGMTPDYLTGCINFTEVPELTCIGWSRLSKAAHFITVPTTG